MEGVTERRGSGLSSRMETPQLWKVLGLLNGAARAGGLQLTSFFQPADLRTDLT